MPTSSGIPDHVREALAARVPVEVRAAFDAAVDARRRFYAATNGSDKRAAFKDLAAANRILAEHNLTLVEQAQRAARSGESQ